MSGGYAEEDKERPRRRRSRWSLAAALVAVLIASGLGYVLLRMPFQLSDNAYHLLIAQRSSLGEILTSEFGPNGVYFRPLLWVTIDVVFELARGSYFATFKGLHVAQLLALLLLFVRVLRVRTAPDFAAASLALVSVVGMHTFAGTVIEAYPINTYLTILVACLAAPNLSYGSPARWRDVAAVLLFAYSLFTLETGVLVLVCLAVGHYTGWRGVSRWAIGACAVILVGYVILRFVTLSGHLPGLDERSSGFGLTALDQRQLVDRFSDHRLLFYAYNVLSSVITVPFAEPRAGVWRFVGTIVRGQAMPLGLVISVVTSVLSTLLILAWARRRWPAWRRRRFKHDDRLVLIFAAVVAVNAVLSFPYTKDVVMSPAGAFYASALYVGLRSLLRELWYRPQGTGFLLGASAMLALLAAGWTIRAAAVPYEMRRLASSYQRDWAGAEKWVVEQKLELNPEQRRLLGQLQRDALSMPVPIRHELAGWPERLVDRP